VQPGHNLKANAITIATIKNLDLPFSMSKNQPTSQQKDLMTILNFSAFQARKIQKRGKKV
jgi:hypothetical protein